MGEATMEGTLLQLYREAHTTKKRIGGELAASVGGDPGTPMISCSIYDCHFEQALCDLGASINIMPKATFEKLSYPALSPTMMCVQLADSTIRYPESIVHNLLVQVKDTFIVTDFVVLDMEGDPGISLILGRPFQRDARAIIDVGTGKISLLIMGKNMKFKFQNKRQEMFLIHEDDKREGLHAEPSWEDWEVHEPPTELAVGNMP